MLQYLSQENKSTNCRTATDFQVLHVINESVLVEFAHNVIVLEPFMWRRKTFIMTLMVRFSGNESIFKLFRKKNHQNKVDLNQKAVFDEPVFFRIVSAKIGQRSKRRKNIELTTNIFVLRVEKELRPWGIKCRFLKTFRLICIGFN